MWSAETFRIYGVDADKFPGTREAFFALIHHDDRAVVRSAAETAVLGGLRYDIELRVQRGDGVVRWVHEQADVVRGPDGEPLRMIGTVQDVTERHGLEDDLRQSQKLEAIGRLAGGIAHDLNNALTAIAGYAELALNEIPEEHVARHDIEQIRRSAERAGSVTRQLLAFSRKQILEPRVFDLNATVADTARLLERHLGANITLRSRLAPDLPPMTGDPGQIEQAVINLAVNARDAMPAGGTLVLETSIVDVDERFARSHEQMPTGRYVVLRVTDTGHGMSRETKNHIFEPFFTTKEPGQGTGLGLSMVYGTVRQVGGFIFVDSEIGRGTMFTLFFPPAKAGEVPASHHSATDHRHETVLIVEDEVVVRDLVASTLAKEGYQLLLAGSAEEALALAASHEGPIHLVLTDVIMPGKSGIELANTLVAERPGLPILLMSGYAGETVDVGGLRQHTMRLQKPFTPRELRQQVREVLDSPGRRSI